MPRPQCFHQEFLLSFCCERAFRVHWVLSHRLPALAVSPSAYPIHPTPLSLSTMAHKSISEPLTTGTFTAALHITPHPQMSLTPELSKMAQTALRLTL